MEKIRETIRQRYPDRVTRFVFPSEITAAFWRKETLRILKLNAVESARFISWDRFKEDSFALFRKEKPVNSALRTVFAYRLLEENRKTGGDFAGIIAPEYADNSPAFLSYIIRILPALGMLSGLTEKKRGKLDSDFLGSLCRLRHLYEEFLSRHGLFEPGFEKADVSNIRASVVVVFPELIEDYRETAPLLDKNPLVRVISCSEQNTIGESFHLLENSLCEFRRIFGQILRLLEDGVYPEDIAVTVCDDKVLPYFQNAAEKYPLLFSYRGGKKVSDFPAGKFFILLRECADSGFHIEYLKKLLLSGIVPWKARDTYEKIIRVGINSMYVMEMPGKGGNARRLEQALGRTGDEELLSVFRKLYRGMLSITESRSFDQLQTALISFSRSFFDQEHWEAVNGRVFEYALNLCSEIKGSLSVVELPPGLRPFQLFLHLLGGSVYVPKTAAGGIPVYPYRVAAGIDPKYHFIISAHHAAVKVSTSPWGFLRKDHKAVLGLEDRDFSSDFLKVYACSGRETLISCVLETFSEKTLIPAAVMKQLSKSIEAERTPDFPDPLQADRGYWTSSASASAAGRNGIHETIFPVQYSGLTNIADRICSPPEKKYNSSSIEDENLRNNITRQLMEDGVPAVSSTSLERFTRCPFSFLLDLLTGRDAPEYEAVYHSAGLSGQFVHEVLRLLYRRIKAETRRFLPEKRELYAELLREAVEKAGRNFFGRGYVLLYPVEREMKGRAERRAVNLFSLEEKYLPGLPVTAAEIELRTEWKTESSPPTAAVLRGKIDRLSGTADSTVLIDYKTTNRITRKDISGEEEAPASFQLPMYVYLAEQNGFTVSRAGYISLSEKKYIPVLKTEEDGKGWFTREEIDEYIREMHRYINAMLERVDRGNYTVLEDDCTPCAYRSVCREKYVTG